MQSKEKNKRTTYRRITQEIRLQLIDRVVQKGQNIKQVVSQMGVNISTAKAILKVYQEQGRVGKKKKRDKVINVIQTYSFYTVDGSNIQKIAQTVIQQQKKSIQTNESREIQQQLKQKSKQRAYQLMKQAIQRYNKANETAQLQKSISQMTAYQQQMFVNYCGQVGPMFPYNQNIGGFPFK